MADIHAGPLFQSDELYRDWNRTLSALIQQVDEMNTNPFLNRTDAYESLTGMAREMAKSVRDFRTHPEKFLRLKVF